MPRRSQLILAVVAALGGTMSSAPPAAAAPGLRSVMTSLHADSSVRSRESRVTTIHVDRRRGRVVVGVSRTSRSLHRALLRRYGSRVLVRRAARAQRIEGFVDPVACPSRSACERVLRGGIELRNLSFRSGGSPRCTLGLPGFSSDNAPAGEGLTASVTTAAHCVRLGQPILHDGAFVGVVDRIVDEGSGDFRNAGGVDAARIGEHTDRWLIRSAVWDSGRARLLQMVWLRRPAAWEVNTLVCKAGIRTGRRCGRITDVRASFDAGGARGRYRGVARVEGMCGRRGDSGAPVYANRRRGPKEGTMLLGFAIAATNANHRRCRNDGTDVTFVSHALDVQAALGMEFGIRIRD